MIIDFLKNKKKPNGQRRLFTCKLTGEELLLLRVKAAKFTDGNVSDWVRYAAIYLLPPVSHIDFGADADPQEMEFYGESRDQDSRRYNALVKELKAFSRKFKKLERDQLQQAEEGDS